MGDVEKICCYDRDNNDVRLELSQLKQNATLIAALKTTTPTT